MATVNDSFDEEITRAVPDRPPRHCPVCGARVAEGAKTCLMCGASLDEMEEAETPPPPSLMPTAIGLSRRQVLILVGIGIILLVGSIALGWNLSQGKFGPPTPTPTLTPTLTPTTTPTPTQTPTPTLSPTPVPTPTPIPPETYIVQPGDTLLGIALEYGITVEELQAYNDLDSDIIVAGQTLLIPPPTPTPGPPPTPRPGEPTLTPAPFILYTVRPGDVLSTIAERFGVSVADIKRANNLPAGSDTIVVDQVLMIPQYTPTPQPESQVIVGGAADVQPVYDPPPLLYPPRGARFVGPDALVVLQWASVGTLRAGEFYRVSLTLPTLGGTTTVESYQQTTAWRVPKELFPSPEVSTRTCSWHVAIVRHIEGEEDTIIAAPKETRTFLWDVAESTVTPTP